jgi:hypothetical protein
MKQYLNSDLRKNIEFAGKNFSGSSKNKKDKLEAKNTATWKRILIQKMAWLRQSQERFL